MRSIHDLELGFFLPLSRMNELAKSARTSYLNAKPFPHIVFDNFLDSSLLDLVLAEFPKPGEIPWQRFDNAQEIKLASAAEASFGPVTRLLLYHLNSITFLEFISAITGIANLIPDPGLEVDSNMSRCETKIRPVFNSLVIFGATDFTHHGHPDPLQCLESMTRKLLALYYLSNGHPAEEITREHTTVFRRRNQEEVKLTLNQRLRNLAKNLLPPILARQWRKGR